MNNKGLNILIVTESIDINDSSGTKGRIALIKNLKEAGFNILVYHYTRKNITLEGINCVSIAEKKFTLLYFLSKIQLIIKRYLNINTYDFIENIFGFSFGYLNDSNSIQSALKKEKEFKPDWVYSLSIGSRLKTHHAILGIPEWHSKWVINIHDPYPMACYPRPYDWVEPGYHKKRRFFIELSKKAKYFTYPSQYLAEWMEGYFPNLKSKEIIIPHQINSDLVKKEVQLPSFFNSNNFNILHAGGLMKPRNPTGLIEGFNNFLIKNPKAKEFCNLIFVGNTSVYDQLIKNYQKTNDRIVISDGYLPFEQVNVMQKLTSVNVILESLGALSPFLPGKFAHCVSAQKPILLLGPYYSESKRLLGNQYANWSSIEDSQKIEFIITALYNSWTENKNKIQSYDELKYYFSVEYLKDTILNKFK